MRRLMQRLDVEHVEIAVRGGREQRFRIGQLPAPLQAALALRAANNDRPVTATEPSPLWSTFDRLPQRLKDEAARRLKLLQAIDRLAANGAPKLQAVAAVAREAGEAAPTLRRWLRLVAGVERADWLPALAPRWRGRTATADCSPEAWDYFKADYLRVEQPCAEACYDRLQRAAAERGWTVPSLRTLLRRVTRELPPAAVALARHGAEALKRTYPAQERDRAVFKALEAVNVDGHKFDVFVRWPSNGAGGADGGEIARPILLAWQDLYSGKILAWRIGRAESADLVRLAFGDLVERFGIPDRAWLDNGRGFASKWITGGTANRYRFKVKDEDPAGVLTLLGVAIHWTTPYSGQSKPIERAFRDLAEYISRHPALAGAYTGNSPDAKPENYASRAVPMAEFLRVVEAEIAAHNGRAGRLSATCAGRSFDETFAESYATAFIRKATAEQRRMLLLAAEGVTAERGTGAIRLFGNRYWSGDVALARAAGSRVVVRFDPDHLDRPMHVYGLDGRFIATCDLVEKAGFDDVTKAKEHARQRRRYINAVKDQLAAERRMTALEASALLPAPPAPAAPQTKVVRPVFATRPAPAPAMTQAERDERFGRSIELLRQQKAGSGL